MLSGGLMATIYFPSCKFKAAYPFTAEQIQFYLNKHFQMNITDCCQKNLQLLTCEDTAVCICNSCAAYCDESSHAKEVLSVLEIIAFDETFVFPDYKGEHIALQDCWRTYDKPNVHNAVRSIMEKMNLKVVELPGNKEKSMFCGTTLLKSAPPYYGKLAPKRFIENAHADLFQNHTPEDQISMMIKHCEQIPTKKVACYCKSCADGLSLGGKQAVHLMELVFNCSK
jgi:hypothetical protein